MLESFHPLFNDDFTPCSCAHADVASFLELTSTEKEPDHNSPGTVKCCYTYPLFARMHPHGIWDLDSSRVRNVIFPSAGRGNGIVE